MDTQDGANYGMGDRNFSRTTCFSKIIRKSKIKKDGIIFLTQKADDFRKKRVPILRAT